MIIEEKIDLGAVAARFQVDGRLIDITRNKTGHINETYVSRFDTPCGVKSYVLQRINHYVFKQPEKVMDNIERVTRYAREKIIAAGGDPERETLNIVPTLSGDSYYHGANGSYWRTYNLISGARTYDIVEDPRHVYSAARAFGKFQKMLSDLPGERLYETIPDFHNTPKRFQDFTEAVDRDRCKRVRNVRPEIDFIQARSSEMSVVVDGMLQGLLPERVTHNDTKLNNVMIDEETGEDVCVIDLDTVMPGSALYDFGDAVRVAASTAAEDERDLTCVGLDMKMFDQLTHGFLDTTRDFLVPAEIDLLVFSARLISLELGMRFLTDHLNGDVYFRIHRPDHNLDRCRTQLKMAAEIERRMPELQAIVDCYRG